MSKNDWEMTDKEWKEELAKRIYLVSDGNWEGYYKKVRNGYADVCINGIYTFTIQESELSSVEFMLNGLISNAWQPEN